MDSIGRFFQPKRLLAPAGAGGLGVLIALYFVQQLIVAHRIRLGAIVLGGFCLLLSVGLVSWAFPRGCKACRALLETRFGVYRPELYDALVAATLDPSPPVLAPLAAQRSTETSAHRALVSLECCPKCQVVGVVSVQEQTWRNSQYWHSERQSSEVPLRPETSAPLATLCG